jgi:hypothetical protein
VVWRARFVSLFFLLLPSILPSIGCGKQLRRLKETCNAWTAMDLDEKSKMRPTATNKKTTSTFLKSFDLKR